MPYLQAAIVPALVLGVAIVMLAAEVRSWRAAKRESLPDGERAFRWRRFRRRTQAAGMLAIVAVLMFAGDPKLMGDKPSIHVATGIWITVFLLLLWIVLLALADAVASWQRTQRLRQDLSVEKAMLQAEIRRQRADTSSDSHDLPEQKKPQPDTDTKHP